MPPSVTLVVLLLTVSTVEQLPPAVGNNMATAQPGDPWGADPWRLNPSKPTYDRGVQDSYRAQLDEQLREKRERQARQKAELEAFEMKQEAIARQMMSEASAPAAAPSGKQHAASDAARKEIDKENGNGSHQQQPQRAQQSAASLAAQQAAASLAVAPRQVEVPPPLPNPTGVAARLPTDDDVVRQLQHLLEEERAHVRHLEDERLVARERETNLLRQIEQMQQRQSEWEQRFKQEEMEWRRQAERKMQDAVAEIRRDAAALQTRLLEQMGAQLQPRGAAPVAAAPWPQGTPLRDRAPTRPFSAGLVPQLQSAPRSRPPTADRDTLPPEELQKLLDEFVKHGVTKSNARRD